MNFSDLKWTWSIINSLWKCFSHMYGSQFWYQSANNELSISWHYENEINNFALLHSNLKSFSDEIAFILIRYPFRISLGKLGILKSQLHNQISVLVPAAYCFLIVCKALLSVSLYTSDINKITIHWKRNIFRMYFETFQTLY